MSIARKVLALLRSAGAQVNTFRPYGAHVIIIVISL